MANKEEEARRLAADYLASMPGQITTEASAPPPVVDAGDITMGDRIKTGIQTAFSAPPKEMVKNAAILGGAALVGGPAGYMAANQAVTSGYAPPGPKTPTVPTAPASEAGPPEPPPVDDSPMVLNQQTGRGTMVSPAGMYPQSMTTQAHQGRPVPVEAKAAFGASTGMQLEGAAHARDADQAYYSQVANLTALKEKATDDARVAHANVAARRQAMAKQKIAEIEATNAEAAAAIDPNKYWTDRGAGAGVLGAIAIALGEFGSKLNGGPNTALNIIDNGVNREIQTQMQNRTLKGQKAARQQQILDLHMGALDNEDKAIDASKLALYDNVLGQVEKYKAQHGAQMSQANYEQLVGGILEKRGELVNKIGLQEEDDINKQYTETWHNAQYAGGGTGTPAGKMDGYELIPVPGSDRTSEKNQMIAVPKGSHQELGKIVGYTNGVIGVNQEALERIREIRKDIELAKSSGATVTERAAAVKRVNDNRKLIEDLAQRKASYLSTSEGQGVLKEPDFERAMNDRVLFTDWWKPGADVEKRIQGQNNSLAGAAGRMVQGVGGQKVKMVYTRDKNGALQPTPLFEGSPYQPPIVGPEMGPVQDPRGKK